MITRFLALFVFMLLMASTSLKAETDPLAALEMKKNAKPAVELGWRYFEKGDYETALSRFQMAIRHDKHSLGVTQPGGQVLLLDVLVAYLGGKTIPVL
jgi:Tfp pilus assembly protein PilF